MSDWHLRMSFCTISKDISSSHLAIMTPIVGKMSGLWATTESRNCLYTPSLSTAPLRSVLAFWAVANSLVRLFICSSFSLNTFRR